MPRPKPKSICFVTGTRAEFGLMQPVLRAIQKHPHCKLQIVATGMHLSAKHGRTINKIRREGWKVDAVVPWDEKALAISTGSAMQALAKSFQRLKPDIVLICGDRVEALAAAAAAHLCAIPVAHVHGGDRAIGQIDDSLRHAITKLSHIHFPATAQSAHRLLKLGEDAWRIHRTGSPAVDGITKMARGRREFAPGKFALLVLHPADADEALEFRRARIVSRAILAAKIPRVAVIYPNNDPGYRGILRCWQSLASDDRFTFFADLDRESFLGLLRDSALLVGNSSSGIIEAGSFGTPVIDVGPRQMGRQRGKNVRNVPYSQAAIARLAARIWKAAPCPRTGRNDNIYGPDGAGAKIATALSKVTINERLTKKIITY